MAETSRCLNCVREVFLGGVRTLDLTSVTQQSRAMVPLRHHALTDLLARGWDVKVVGLVHS